ncbi:MAG: PmoA family protein [Verrucomicrobiota bacterium]
MRWFLFTSLLAISIWLPPQIAAAPVIVTESDKTVIVSQENRPIFQYNKQPTSQAKSAAPHFSRTGYIHPLYTPSGKVVTGDYAADHPHQHGLFFAWTKSQFRGEPTEFWNQAKKLGDIRFGQFQKKSKPLELEFRQIFTTGKDSDAPVLNETWHITFPKEPSPSHYQFDLTSTQTAATEAPLLIQKHHYGGMAIRGHDAWLPEDKDSPPRGTIITSEGKTRENGNHSRPRWVVMHGPIDGHHCGVAVLAHPSNFRSPQWVRLHPNKPYFVFAPMVEEPFRIEKGQPYISRFRYLTFDDEPDLELIETVWKDFAKE